MKTHLTMSPGGRKKFSFHSVLQENCQNMLLSASLRFSIVKIIEKRGKNEKVKQNDAFRTCHFKRSIGTSLYFICGDIPFDED